MLKKELLKLKLILVLPKIGLLMLKIKWGPANKDLELPKLLEMLPKTNTKEPLVILKMLKETSKMPKEENN